jgi:hypothetical protein
MVWRILWRLLCLSCKLQLRKYIKVNSCISINSVFTYWIPVLMICLSRVCVWGEAVFYVSVKFNRHNIHKWGYINLWTHTEHISRAKVSLFPAVTISTTWPILLHGGESNWLLHPWVVKAVASICPSLAQKFVHKNPIIYYEWDKGNWISINTFFLL